MDKKDERSRRRRELALTFSPGERLWVWGVNLTWIGLVGYFWLIN
jgi:hypothetical protein